MKNRTLLGMALFIASEAIFFLLLILAYVRFHKFGVSPNPASFLDPLKTGTFSLALLSSSATIWLADICRNKNSKWLWLCLLATIGLGLIFLIGQSLEYSNLLAHHVTISQNLFGSTFFTLTGFHCFHVFIGLILITILLALTVFGRKLEPTGVSLQAVSMYWHFVDAVWIVIFSVVYL
jgi:heme/copper-type cytochrome/quinol oxidase subunit 3